MQGMEVLRISCFRLTSLLKHLLSTGCGLAEVLVKNFHFRVWLGFQDEHETAEGGRFP